MFSWHLPSQSRIKDIISSGNFTLEDLLQESYDIVVSAASDETVYRFLTEPVQLSKMIDYVLIEPVRRDQVSPDQIPDLQKQLLFSNTACDVIAQSHKILEAILQDKTYLDTILTVLTTYKTHMVFHRVTMIIVAIIAFGAMEITTHIKETKKDFVKNLVSQIGHAPTEDVLSIVRQLLKSNARVPGVAEWLASEQIIRLLISNLGPDTTDLKCKETIVVLQDILDITKSQMFDNGHDTFSDFDITFSSSEEEYKHPKPPPTATPATLLLKQFDDPETLDLFYSNLLQSQVSMVHALPFVTYYITQVGSQNTQMVDRTLAHMDGFLGVVQSDRGAGVEAAEFGFRRLAVMKFLLALSKLELMEVSNALIDKGWYGVALEIMFTHRYSSVVHGVVTELFTVGFNRGPIHLHNVVDSSHLLNRIADAWDGLKNDNQTLLNNDVLNDHALLMLKRLFKNFKPEPPFRVEWAVTLQVLKSGPNWTYFGHLFRLANLVMNASTQDSGDVCRERWQKVQENERWMRFVEEGLKVYNAIARQELDPDYSSDSTTSGEEECDV